ncbi:MULTISPECIES: helix-turn-helix domain-containing protein [Staphylococcus]|uniref:helix-turn-helix domain-containing protein n=1 Tax=Staphylococcus TaxID=1279 RepID=UPI0008534136|nr:helix-turn-helix transcriptional regulator [Staphylococcus equorum]MDK9845189.1 helix-turn-helix transcriptional regulator [Staphylococcus equorum]MDK9849124.1 helix-turn-helix transcriptional regulator [Staphylococcus equorum]MDK9854431.1 helix-turn-helix transcriptional regulator [Staphylococcus equorum]OEK55385.1 XRE family transcriptional regulator [Staphylococcus equorum]QPT00086.1 helix-turn-helix transcriptional regulator [Staphylococcus equorum]
MNTVQIIKNLCSQNNITIAELERKLDFSNGQIARWKKSTPGVDRLKKVADYFDVSVDFLLDREKENHKGEDLPEDIRIMQRAAQNMSEEDRKRAIKVFEAFFDNWDEITKDDK